MIDRDGFEALQNRWAAGDALRPVEDEARRRYAAEDPLAARELALFNELSGRLAAAADDDSPSVAAALARARGVRLRVVGPGEAPARPRSTLGRAGLGAALVIGAAAAFALLSRAPRVPEAKRPGSASPSVASVAAAPLPVTVARSELVFASGDVRVGAERAVVGEKTLAEGATVRTGDGRACLTIDPTIDVCLGPASEVTLEALRGASLRVRVVGGTAVAALAPRSAGQTFALAAGKLEATAHGTVYALEASDGRPVRVAVLEGTVSVSEPGEKSELLGAHAGLSVRAGAARAVDAVGRGEEARLSAWLRPRELARGGSFGVLELGEQGSLRALLDDQGPYDLPLRAFVSAGRHRVTLRAPGEPDRTLDADVEAGGVRRVTPTARSVDAAVPSARALLEQARDSLARGDSRAARVLYERLRETHPVSPEARTILVPLGKLELEAGAASRALSTFDAYVKGGGPLLPEALSGRVKALRALGRPTEERRAIEDLLARYPKTFEAPALSRRLQALGAL